MLLCNVHLHIQLDNTTQNNKNNLMFKYLSFLVCSQKVASAEAAFLRKGHTHEDIDQLFGRLVAWILRHHVIEVPQQFVIIISNFLVKLSGRPWPAPEFRQTIILNSVRGWKTWQEVLGMTCQDRPS